jgi:hypothetical protein
LRNCLVLLCLILTACVTVRQLEVTPLGIEQEEDDAPIIVESPVKVHLDDGSTIVYADGIVVHGDKVIGDGLKYDITLEHQETIEEVSVDDIAAIESFQTPVNRPATAVASTAATTGSGLAGLTLLKLVFGSCPTTYSLEGDVPLLEAESFSYSIAPGFEARDIDRLGIEPGAKTSVTLEMRNEALETHYIDHVELMEVIHSDAETVFPDPKGRPLVVGAMIAPDKVVDSSGRRVDAIVRAPDGEAWRSDVTRLRNVSLNDMQDHVDLEFNMPDEHDGAALVIRLRNSLLNTVLLYDVMLKGQGYRALDWMGDDLDRLGTKYRLARWYQKKMGMRVLQLNNGHYREVATVADTGPIAWDEIAIPVPDTSSGTMQIRLEFVADNWRIDHVALATQVKKGRAKAVPVAEVRSSSGELLELAGANLQAADDSYLITKPGEYVRLHFEIGERPADRKRTYFLASEGYYIEWMRKDWLESTSASAFEPSDAALLTALQLWEPRREGLREQFESTKIQVR